MQQAEAGVGQPFDLGDEALDLAVLRTPNCTPGCKPTAAPPLAVDRVAAGAPSRPQPSPRHSGGAPAA